MSQGSGTGRLIVLSGPSGSGKSTVIARALAAGDLPIRRSVSVTTRPPRPGERNGVDYYFWSPAQFDEALQNGEFLEWAEIHGHRYGTLKREVESHLRQGYSVLLEIDVQGAQQIRQQFPEVTTIFLEAPSLADYERRLRQRGTEDEASLQRRLDIIERELAHAPQYDLRLVNRDLEQTVAQLRQLLRTIISRSPKAPSGA
ncbi:Guanylate kinase [bacterium HR36]|nr:Guanylate kinase [bacterium HR36]